MRFTKTQTDIISLYGISGWNCTGSDLGYCLVEKVGTAVAEEMEEFHIDLWLASGLNIQRNLCAAEI